MGNPMTVTVSDMCLQEYQALKVDKKHKYILFNLDKSNTEIVVEKVSSSTDYDDFIADLPETECRWAVYDFEFEKEGAGRNKLTFVSWMPETVTVKQKVLFASSEGELRRSLEGIELEIKGTEYSEVAYASVLEKVSHGN
jgi:cofilin